MVPFHLASSPPTRVQVAAGWRCRGHFISLNPLCHARRLQFHIPYQRRHSHASARCPIHLDGQAESDCANKKSDVDFASSDQPSPGLTISLSSNNPFRNRAASPLPKSPASPFDDPAPQSASSTSQPPSNNPFLDSTRKSTSPAITGPLITMADEKETKPSFNSEDLFVRAGVDSSTTCLPACPATKGNPSRAIKLVFY